MDRVAPSFAPTRKREIRVRATIAFVLAGASLESFDMFPQTAHVETVCELVPALTP